MLKSIRNAKYTELWILKNVPIKLLSKKKMP